MRTGLGRETFAQPSGDGMVCRATEHAKRTTQYNVILNGIWSRSLLAAYKPSPSEERYIDGHVGREVG